MLAVVHDLAEAQGKFGLRSPDFVKMHKAHLYSLVGDIAPREGIPKAEKRRLEAVCPWSCWLRPLLD